MRSLSLTSARVVQLVGKIPVLGTALRRLARGYADGSVVTIRTGLGRGLQWMRRKHYVNGFWIGNYEPPMQAALERWLKPGAVFYDVGANAGFFSLLGARLVGQGGAVYAFEPLPENAALWREQVRLNGFSNCYLEEAALDAGVGEAVLQSASGATSVAHLGAPRGTAERGLTVATTTLDTFARVHHPPDVVKMDIEGAEDRALEGASQLLARGCTWIIELHELGSTRRVIASLKAHNYTLTDLQGRELAHPEQSSHFVACRS